MSVKIVVKMTAKIIGRVLTVVGTLLEKGIGQ